MDETRFIETPGRRIDLPSYPKAFISTANLSRERDRVFSAMPFNAEHSDQLWKIIQGVCSIRGLNLRRADSPVYPNPILVDILDELEKAEIIIADLTGLNANVLYELGIAHVRCDSVILVCKKGQILPFDLGNIRCIYFDFGSPKMQVEFAERLGKSIDALKAIGPPTLITSPIDRTKAIVSDLERLSNLTNDELAKEVVWYSGFLSPFAISANETFPEAETELQTYLLKEKEAILSLARRGCKICCIITPPSADFIIPGRAQYAATRVNNLLDFLNGQDNSLNNIVFVVSAYQQKSIYIIGKIACFEGFRKELNSSGYSLTLRQTGLAVTSNIALYEVLSKKLASDQITTKEFDKIFEIRKLLNLKTIEILHQSKQFLQHVSIS
jgi:hypothetical protein